MPVEESGDEPHMLARDLAGVPDRRLPPTASAPVARPSSGSIRDALILDDGFQHLQLARTIDLLVLSSADLTEQLLPSGRLREPLSAARTADAVLVYGDAEDARRVASEVGVPRLVLRVTRRLHPLRPLSGSAPDASAR